ncbi:UDP-N-acetylglucosamine--N-acetylmuramyl-(pentapeptide) pyrophosphoryl-undecaprenol N-acetylglucosamine transferase [Candidatus Saccharibacteria bacterium]|nr:UDP-N-acetylglucosamine--N-acetylmuramyl-(pentapeptide) pyrophosphoryl-undecaprenol N-acetylglucosamine transferase [Candidatus Saccharibacteria bacterium]
MKILVVGGGSGGHITPAMSVIREIFRKYPNTQVEFWTDRKYYKNISNLANEMAVSWGEEEGVSRKNKQYIRVRKIFAGKFRRYHGLKIKDYFDNGAKTFFDVVFGNLVGAFGFLLGLVQSFLRLLGKKNRPDVIFLKGGFVGLPVGMVAGILKIPYVIHESDAVFGLTNRILMKKAAKIATGVPVQAEKYGAEIASKIEWVGIPVAPEFAPVSSSRQSELKRELGFNSRKKLVVITGGSQGSEHLNTATRAILERLLEDASVGLIAGRKYYDEMLELKDFEKWNRAKLDSDFRMWSFSPKMHEILGAADLVVSRAGATTISELAALEKPVILVPFEKLPGGHQAKNAERLQKAGAVEVVSDAKMEEKPELLLSKIKELLDDDEKRVGLAVNLKKIAKSDASVRMMEIIMETKNRKRR